MPRAALVIEEVRAELDGDAAQAFEGVRQQQQLALGVEVGVRCTLLRYQVDPISTRLLAASAFM